MGKLNKVCVVTIIKNGKEVQEIVKLRGLELEEVHSDTEWIPANLEKDEVKYIEHQVDDTTMKYLKIHSSFTLLRYKKYAQSLRDDNDDKLSKLVKSDIGTKKIQEAREEYDKNIENFEKTIPKCIEQIIYSSIFPAIHQKVNTNIERVFDKENEELYPKK
jgi:hypothetical protein